MAAISICLLGPLQFRANDQDLPRMPRKAEAILAYLAGNAGRAVPREKLAGILWENSPAEQAQRSLRQALVGLRRGLGAGADRILPSRSGDLTVSTEAAEIDLLDFEAMVRSSRREDLQRGVELYRGELLADFPPVSEAFDEWKLAMRSRAARLAGEALERLAAVQAEAGEFRSAVVSARRLLELDPLREEAHRLLMRLHFTQGHRTEALRQFAACAEILKRELSVAPEPETLALMRVISSKQLEAASSTAEATIRTITQEPSQTPAGPLELATQSGTSASSLSIPNLDGSAILFDKPSMPVPPVANLARDRDQKYFVEGSDKPSIAIFRFTIMGVDRNCDRFADGLVDGLVTAVSRCAFVVSGGRLSNEYTDTVANHRHLATTLQAQFLLTGSVRKAGNRIRATARLIDGETGRHLWAERYDGSVDDPLALEDRISTQIYSGLRGILFDINGPVGTPTVERRLVTVISGRDTA